MIKAVIFDLDGVIVSTDEFHYLAWKQLADKEGIAFDKVINNQLRGVSRSESLKIILKRSIKAYSEDEKKTIQELKNKIYLDFLENLSPKDLLPNSLEIIEYLKDKGIKVAIGSSSRNTKKILEQLNIINIFDAIADGNDITKSKPNPEVFLVASQKLGILPDECAVVEDAMSGIEAANAAGMLAIAINDATKSKYADYKIYNLEDIKKII
jgi:beta-phosphoglucomutase